VVGKKQQYGLEIKPLEEEVVERTFQKEPRKDILLKFCRLGGEEENLGGQRCQTLKMRLFMK